MTGQELLLNIKEKNIKNFVFLGEAGCGKSEISLNFAKFLSEYDEAAVHFFDMDQTKPLMRSRDVFCRFDNPNLSFHFERQYFDAPTQVGGVTALLLDNSVRVILDVGGDDIGARLIGCYSHILNRPDTAAFYVINPYRPWSKDIDSIDMTFSKIIGVSRIKKVHIIANPNVGETTSQEEFMTGLDKVKMMVDKYLPVEAAVCRESIFNEVSDKCSIPLYPIRTYLAGLYD